MFCWTNISLRKELTLISLLIRLGLNNFLFICYYIVKYNTATNLPLTSCKIASLLSST